MARPAARGPNRIAHIELDTEGLVRWSPEIDHERRVAVFDLIENNVFELESGFGGPYVVRMSLRDATLVMEVASETGDEKTEVALPLRGFRKLIKDYFLVCESYFSAIKTASPSRIEAIDMGRRGLHNEGSERLSEALKGKVLVDRDTARRLFTLVCVLHIRA